MTVDEALSLLSKFPEYNWLINATKQFWNVSEVAQNLEQSEYLIRSRCKDGSIQGAYALSQQAGYTIPRSGLLLFLASLLVDGKTIE